jgi:hypothetical protein
MFVVSVLLDAGAGSQWTYHEKSTDLKVGRSEGLCIYLNILGLASYDMFLNQCFSSTPLTVDGTF